MIRLFRHYNPKETLVYKRHENKLQVVSQNVKKERGLFQPQQKDSCPQPIPLSKDYHFWRKIFKSNFTSIPHEVWLKQQHHLYPLQIHLIIQPGDPFHHGVKLLFLIMKTVHEFLNMPTCQTNPSGSASASGKSSCWSNVRNSTHVKLRAASCFFNIAAIGE